MQNMTGFQLPHARLLRALVITAITVVLTVTSAGMLPAAAEHGPVSTAERAAVCDRPPVTANRRASLRARAVHIRLWLLTCGHGGRGDGVLSGQSIGHGAQAADPDGWFGYARHVEGLAEQTGRYVGIVSVDYEHDRVYTPEQLATANQYLIAHARRGGLVTVTWSPLGPWMNDELDLEGNPGDWTDTRTNAAFLSGGADLRDVIDPTTEVGKVWRRKLERIADALAELRAAGVVVLWRPMQEMNGYWFWWGHLLQGDDSTAYQDIWRDMFRFFTYERHLDNLLWVYSPAQNRDSADGEQAAWVKDSDWAYPGTRYVDVVAGTAYRDDLHIPNYGDYLALPEVVAMAEFSAALMGEHDRDGDLDTTLYATRLREDYPAVAYWVSWHDFPWSETEDANLSLVRNLRVEDLFADPYVLTADDLARPRRGGRDDRRPRRPAGRARSGR